MSVVGIRVDPEAARAEWVGRPFAEFVLHKRLERQAARAWLYQRSMGVRDGVIRVSHDFEAERAAIEARRVDRTTCWRCGVRADVGCEHQRWAA